MKILSSVTVTVYVNGLSFIDRNSLKLLGVIVALGSTSAITPSIIKSRTVAYLPYGYCNACTSYGARVNDIIGVAYVYNGNSSVKSESAYVKLFCGEAVFNTCKVRNTTVVKDGHIRKRSDKIVAVILCFKIQSVTSATANVIKAYKIRISGRACASSVYFTCDIGRLTVNLNRLVKANGNSKLIARGCSVEIVIYFV